MFERRLKIFFGLLFCVTLVLVGRAVHLQIVQKQQWQDKARDSLKRTDYLETLRGELQDVRGRWIARDDACIDAAVDYRAVVKDAEWIKRQARARARGKPELGGDREHAAERLAEQVKGVEADIDGMWLVLARVSGKTADEIEEIKSSVISRVEIRKRSAWYGKLQKALKQRANHGPTPWYKRWLTDDKESGPDIDQLSVTVSEQLSSHVILRAIDTQTYNELDKNLARYPGLVLKQSAHRVYSEPANRACAHLLGHLSGVTKEDLDEDPNVGVDALRRYYPHDLIGRTGLEALAEETLRGSLGKQEWELNRKEPAGVVKPVPGGNVRCAIDVDLQAQIMQAFVRVKLKDANPPEERTELHGAAVVIDVPTGEVRAMVTYPTYDANRFDADYAALLADEVNKPLMNRATQAQLEPGSSVKTIIGSVGGTKGFVGVNEGIECGGFLVLKDYPRAGTPHLFKDLGRCWTARLPGQPPISHHQVPYAAPHHGHDNNPDGYLTLADAIQRSCNVYFETLADRMGLREVSGALNAFGLGQPTGVGIAEVSGHVPHGMSRSKARMTACFAGIGQGEVSATPIQMANVAATLARDGVWMRPKLLASGTLPPATGLGWQGGGAGPADSASPAGPAGRSRACAEREAESPGGDDSEDQAVLAAAKVQGSAAGAAKARPADAGYDKFYWPRRKEERVDLHLSAPVMAAIRRGMVRVANTRAGTGTQAHREDMYVAAKTGSAQAREFNVLIRDARGKPIPNPDGTYQRRWYKPNELPWYRGVGANHDQLAHAWYIGFAPADRPQVAFAVLVEYGGSGGLVAGAVAKELLDACVEGGYLRPPPTPPANKGWLEE